MTECTREFKVGDKVVLENEPSLAQIHKTDGRWPIIKWLDDNTESNVRLDFLRHATDEEIAVGRRIEHIVDINDIGDSERLQQWKNNIQKFAGFRASNLSKNESQPVLIVERDNQIIERLKAENLAMQAEIDLLKEALDIKESLNNALRARDEARQSMPIKYAE
jgi:hypothetical protein